MKGRLPSPLHHDPQLESSMPLFFTQPCIIDNFQKHAAVATSFNKLLTTVAGKVGGKTKVVFEGECVYWGHGGAMVARWPRKNPADVEALARTIDDDDGWEHPVRVLASGE
ncbi:MAG: hypothetical protein M2R45_03378 [Verrucomicrobia subdivision 3 bacterium]|nr:hypothetical protein [Limisphaerales bacterium]MCS1416709.1 hypothetical protein [Limisphaerales bacterium]